MKAIPSLKGMASLIKFHKTSLRKLPMSTQIRNQIASTKLLVTYFSHPGCTVCKSLLPKTGKLVQDYPDITFQYVNTENEQEIAGQYLVFAVPTIIIFNQGRELTRFSRYFSVQELKEFLEDIISSLGI
jgi:thioredoxin-like negative regulator of GroEL